MTGPRFSYTLQLAPEDKDSCGGWGGGAGRVGMRWETKEQEKVGVTSMCLTLTPEGGHMEYPAMTSMSLSWRIYF